jgi:hypothetical protein
MINKLWVIVLVTFFISCNTVVVRQDPYPPPTETNDYSLLSRFCNKTATLIGCSIEYDTDLSKALTVYAPYKGDLTLYGCGIDEKIFISSSGKFHVELPDYFFTRPNTSCILDLLFTWRLPEKWKQTIPTRSLRGRIFVERGDLGAKQATISYQGVNHLGIAPIRVREGFESLVLPQITIKTTEPTSRGYFSLFGCGSGIKELGFNGNEISIDVAKLVTPPARPGDCFLFGFAIGMEGLNNFFSVPLNVYATSTVKVGASATIDAKKNKICYEADQYVSLVAYGSQISNDLKGCFDKTQETIISFYTVQGRATHLELKNGVFQWTE